MNARGLNYQAYWKQHVDAYRNGSLTKKNYCKAHKLKYHQFGYWLKKFKTGQDLVPIRIKPVIKNTARFTSTGSADQPVVLCTLQLKHGLLQVHDANTLRVILNVLGSNAV